MKKEDKESFILYNSFYEPIKSLKNEQLGRLLRAIFNYTINGEITQEDDIMIAFMFIKGQIDKNTEKWEIEKNKRSEAGRLGGIQRALNQKQKLSSKSKQCLEVLSNDKQNQANQADNVNVYVNVDEYVNENVNDNDNIYDYIQENFGRLLAPADYEKISEWEDNDLTRYAIKKAVINNKCSVGYIDGILRGYRRNKIVTVQQAQDEEEQFIKQKEQNNKYKGLSYKEQQHLREQEILDKFVRGEI